MKLLERQWSLLTAPLVINMNIDSIGLEEKIGYSFKNKDILRQALSHSSYTNELGEGYEKCNERLEFLGDAVLEIITSETLYFKYHDMREGELSKLRARLVCEPSLAEYSKRISLSDYMLLGKGEEKTGGRGRASIISDCMEALIGALFIDAGIEETKKFIEKNILYDIENTNFFSDNKTALQEFLQAKSLVPTYALVGESGPSHDKTFTVTVSLGDRVLGEGSARTKKSAEQIAAGKALALLSREEKE